MDDVKTPNSIRDLLQRPTAIPRPPSANAKASTADEEDAAYTAYAQGRISRHSQQSIIFRSADGSIRAFAYAFLYGVESGDPACGFMLDFTQQKVKVQGCNLEGLMRLICEHRVAEVREIGRVHTFSRSADAPVVQRIEFLNP